MIRKFLAREGQFLLQEFGAPAARTLLLRAVFWVYFVTSCGIMLGGLHAIYMLFGMPAFWAAIFVVYLLYLWNLRRTPVYLGDGSEFGLDLGGSVPTLPPGRAALPPSGTDRSGGQGSHHRSAPSVAGPEKVEVMRRD